MPISVLAQRWQARKGFSQWAAQLPVVGSPGHCEMGGKDHGPGGIAVVPSTCQVRDEAHAVGGKGIIALDGQVAQGGDIEVGLGSEGSKLGSARTIY